MKKSKLLLLFALIFFLLSVILFSYKQKIFIFSQIDAERFSQFGTFISAVLGFITVMFLYFTFNQTQQTQNIASKTFNETKRNSLTNTFFSLIQSHQNIVSHLHNRISLKLKLQYNELCEQNGNHNSNQDYKNFFELMYGMLDLSYKGRNEIPDRTKIVEYFKNQEWVMGHYFRSLEYFINWIEANPELVDDTAQKFFILSSSWLNLRAMNLDCFFIIQLVERMAEGKIFV